MTASADPVALPAAGTYRVDPSRTTIDLATRHMFGLGGVSATFRLREATLTITDPAAQSSLHAIIDAASFTSNNATRNEHVRQPKFLDVAQYPDIIVDAGSAALEDGHWTTQATVTARGVSVPATLTVTEIGTDAGGQVTLRAQMRVDRYAHGMQAAKGIAGRWMNLTVTAVANPT